MSRRSFCLCLLGTLLAACSYEQMPKGANLTSVQIPQTDVRDQGGVGFCWGYTTLGLVESLLLQQGLQVDLSEEALTFQKMADALHVTFTKAASSADLVRVNIDATGWTRYPDGYATRPENAGIRDGLELVDAYGVVPESAWSFKFTTSDVKTRVFRNIQNRVFRFAQKLEAEGRSLASASRDELIDAAMVGDGTFPTRPPESYSWNGKTIAAKQFLQGKLKLNLADFSAVMASELQDADGIIAATKRSLAAGVPVPIGFPLSIARIHDNVFMGRDIPPPEGRDALIASFASDGGHMMLATDFVNLGGREGSLPPAELAREVEKPASELDYLKLKNSWGVGPRLTGWGLQVGASVDGFYKVDREYLEAVARVAGTDPRYVPLVVVVHKSFLKTTP